MTPEEIQIAKEFLQVRQAAYQRTFAGTETPTDSRIVLADLAEFCRATRSTWHQEASVASKLDGRREVWLRIQQHLQLSDEHLWRLLQQGR